ncbi:MAG: AraC family transcriptional regulator [Acidobacteriota bacterium]
MADVLSDVLGDLGLRGEVFCRTTLGPGISLSFPTGQAHFHVIERGPCWITIPDDDISLLASSGDLLLLVAGSGHAVASDERAAVDHGLWDIVPSHYDAERLTLDLSDDEPCVEMICGRFSMDSVGSEAVVGVLPSVVHLRGRSGQLVDGLASMLRLLSAEATSNAPGSSLARARLVELILIGAIRRWLVETGDDQAGWLPALRDPVVGAALGNLHTRPEHPWTVSELSSTVGLSRSPFAARFKSQVGVSPMKYLTSWRMRLAVRLLRRGTSVGEAASAVGYASDAAFSRTFKKEMGVPPSSFR